MAVEVVERQLPDELDVRHQCRRLREPRLPAGVRRLGRWLHQEDRNRGDLCRRHGLRRQPLTGGVYPAKYPTQQAWEDAQVSFISYVGDALRARGYYLLANTICYIRDNRGSDDGSLTAGFWKRLAPHVGGFMSEYWIQTSNDTTRLRAEGNGEWSRNWSGWLNLMTVAQNAGADFFAEMYGSSSNTNIMRYGRGSFLLGWDGHGGAFEWTPDDGRTDPWSPEWTMDIGTPTAARYKVGVGWRRDYTGGTVIVNPDPSRGQSFQLGGTFYRPDGSTLTSVTLGPTEALILRR